MSRNRNAISERGHNTVGASRGQLAILLLKSPDEIITGMKRIAFIFCLTICGLACATPGQIATNTPQQPKNVYPPFIENTPERQQAVKEAWKKFLAEWRMPEVNADLMPVLNTPRSLPVEIAGRININTKGGKFDEVEAKEALKRFIEKSSAILSGDSIPLSNLSLTSFSNEGNFFRALYWQANYPFQIAEGYGELRIVISKTGQLLQLSSTLLPEVTLPTQAEVKSQTLYDKLLNREFTYTSFAGRAQTYKVSDRQEIKIGELVVYPKVEGNRLEIHLALPVVVGKGMTWTVYFDAINGTELGVKQNFAT